MKKVDADGFPAVIRAGYKDSACCLVSDECMEFLHEKEWYRVRQMIGLSSLSRDGRLFCFVNKL